MARFVSKERRLVLRVLDCWEYLRGERPYPSLSEVDPGIFADDWKHCVLIDTGDSPESWTFRHIGAGYNLPDAEAMDGAKWSSRDRSTFLGLTTSYIGKVLDRRVPVSISGVVDEGEKVYRYRSILVPLSDDGQHVNGVLGAANRNEEVGLGAIGALETEDVGS